MLLDAIVSFLCAFSASLGIGGGGLLVIYLSKIKDIPQKQAQGINLIFFVITMSVTLIFHKFKGRIITDNLPFILLPCLIGGIIGSFASGIIGQDILKNLFGAFLVLCSLGYLIREFNPLKKK